MACDPNELLEAAKCFQCKYDSLGALYAAVEIRLLCAIRDGEQLECDPDTLAQEASCILACVPIGAMEAVKLSILCDIVAAAGGGGNGEDEMVQAFPDNETFFSEVSFASYDNVPGLVGVTDITFRMVTSRGFFDFEFADQLVSVSFPNLTTIGDGTSPTYLWISDCPLFTTISAPLLSYINTVNVNDIGLYLTDNDTLASISFPSLVTINGAVTCARNTLLTSLSLPLWVPNDFCQISFEDCALTAASVNHILARCVASPSWGNNFESVTLGGGTSAAPTGQGLIDKATLQARGAFVGTN